MTAGRSPGPVDPRAAVDGEYDIVIEAAGSESALASAVGIAKPSGHVAIPGIYWGPVALPGLVMCFKQVTLCPTTLYGRHAAGRDIDAAVDAFATAADRASGAIEVVLEP